MEYSGPIDDQTELDDARLDTIIKYAPGLIYWKDKNSVHLGCNDKFAQMAGLSSCEEVIGKTDHELYWSAEADLFIKDDLEVIRSGKPKLNIENVLPTASGKTEVVRSNKVPLYDKKGRIAGVLGIATVITDLIEAKEQLEIAQYDMEAIVKYAPGLIYWKDGNSVHVGCNDKFAQMAGLSSCEEVVGKTDHELYWSAEADSFIKDDLEVIRSGKPKLNIEDVLPTASGKTEIVISSKVPLYDKEGKILGVLGIATVVTDLMKTKERLKVANKVKSEFIANISHDLRVPMTGVLGMLDELYFSAEKIQSTVLSTENTSQSPGALLDDFVARTKEYTAIARDSANELTQLFNDILETIKLESGKIYEVSKPFDCRSIIKNNVTLLKSVAEHKKLELKFDISDNVPVIVTGLSLYLERILLNLVSNALKFTEEGSISIIVDLEDSLDSALKKDEIILKIQVVDTGIGIPKDKFNSIFDNFCQLTPSYKGIYKGSGLGLYTVKGYLEAMKGKINVKSKVGEGSCFTLRLPFTVTPQSAKIEQIPHVESPVRKLLPHVTQSVSSKSNQYAVSSDATRILLVEDSPAAAMAGKLMLKRLGCEVDCAKNGAEAIEKASSNNYDLIFMDIGLPDIAGIEVARKIRSLDDEKKSTVPVVALTGHADGKQRELCFSAGMQDVLIKPTQTMAVQSTLKTWARNKKQDNDKADKKTINSTLYEYGQLDVIDWNGCVKALEGDEQFAYELLLVLHTDLKEKTIPNLKQAYLNQDPDALLAELHRCLGGVVYFRLPLLEKALRDFQRTVKANPQEKETLEKAYQFLMEAIHIFLTQASIVLSLDVKP